MPDPLDQRLTDHLAGFITAHKRALIEQVLAARTRHLTVVLEDIYQPQNAGAVIRSCDCFGIQDLHVIERGNRFRPNPAVTRGAEKWVDVIRHCPRHGDSTRTGLDALRRAGYRLAALTLRDGAIPLGELDVRPRTALCIGAEETGLSDLAHGMADVHVHIPMAGFTQSLNLAVTAAICLCALTARLRASDTAWQLGEAEKAALRLRWYRKVVAHPDAHLDYLRARVAPPGAGDG